MAPSQSLGSQPFQFKDPDVYYQYQKEPEFSFSRQISPIHSISAADGAIRKVSIIYHCAQIEGASVLLEFTFGKRFSGIPYEVSRGDDYLLYDLKIDTDAMANRYTGTRLEAIKELHEAHGDAIKLINNVQMRFTSGERVEAIFSYLLMIHLGTLANTAPFSIDELNEVQAFELDVGVWVCDGYLWDSEPTVRHYIDIRFGRKCELQITNPCQEDLLYFNYGLQHGVITILTLEDIERSREIIGEEKKNHNRYRQQY